MTSHTFSLCICFVIFIQPTKPFSKGKVHHLAAKKACGAKAASLCQVKRRQVGKMLRRFYPSWLRKANGQTFQQQESGVGSQKMGIS
ncbi:hypothetical protein ACK356_03000 [Aeromonas veronii]|uniref:hypothetical protein n=1 Tax=Aeromonas TaxID=642 RepID=UPI001608E68A|nr:hypothetical protein [Aeromonas veronii]MCS3835273.1 hypothetical protein [Aeromonas veronii]MEB5669597.1 hypothetical protein [Aeromonas veronii]HDX8429025.1 hypothetical protein [Aeromonas veronii]